MLPVQNSPPAALPSDPPPTKHECLLPDPECSSFCFEPLSPASSPEPLPSLPVSLTLELETTTSEPKSVHPEEFLHQDDSAASVFKWHTVLPPSEPYIDSSFTTFQSTPQTLPLASVRSPVLSETPSLPVPQTLVLSVPPPGTAASFQENEQSLPFPTELSPLALQLPLSPTFSSLDGDGLSPTPSLADLVHLFSIDDDLGIGVEFSNSEAVAATCPPPSTGEANAQEASQPVQTVKANKPRKCRKKSCRRKLAKTEDSELMNVDSIYTSMQPSLEEVEEQLFISFTSKEALKLHVVDSEGSVSQKIPEGHLQPPADSPEDVETADGLEENIAAFQKILVRDLKLMRHRQVIHPVLQAVGLKMNLLDPAQPIDLQYLGVHLPPPGLPVEPLSPERPPSQGVCGVFVSRTGKTTDVTQIKGWREKFSPLEAPPPPAAEAGPGSDPQKKNLSAFCSDMLDEYLENEGKLIDQRADSFSQPQLDPPVYQLPRSSTSYVRTLDSVLKKQSAGSPTSDLISGFIPPSKRPKPTLKESRTSRRDSAKHRISKPHKQRPEAASALMHESSLAESQPGPKQPAVQTPAAPPSSELSSLVTKSSRLQKQHLKVWPEPPQPPAVKKRRKLKPRTMSQTLAPPGSTDLPLTVSEDLAPLESDSELGDQNHCVPVMTRALLRQKDLEDGGVWEGQPRTRITEERAAIALTSLFTLKGFVMDNPTSPVQVVRRRAPPCLNEFCRLGCVCCSLSHCCRISHCGRPACMLGCSCLKQKVVLLKNLDTDCCPSHQGEKKRRRKRRMKMAYVLKEADSVSQPAQRVQTLWKRDSRDSDPEPIHAPEPASLSRPLESREDSSCARVRGYRLKRKSQRQETPEEQKTKDARLKRVKLKEPQTSGPPSAKPDQPVSSARPLSPAAEPNPKPSKRLIILTESKWGSAADRSQVLQQLCERMARDQLDEPFWVSGYRIIPISQTAEGSGPDRCHQYRVHISRPEPEQLVTAADAEKRPQQETTAHPQQQDHLKQVFREAEPPEDWQRELEEEEVESLDHLQQVEKEEEPPEDWKQEMEEEEAEPIEDWQREVEEGDSEEEVGSTGHQVHDGSSREYLNVRSEKKKRVSLGLPFLTGVSPAGFLSTNRKQPGGTDHLVQVNGKLYPLAKIQLGQMGALHPANRLAAYLTGRVGSNRKQQSSSLSSSKPAQNQSPGRTLQTASLSSPLMFVPPPKPQPSVPVLRLQAPPTEFQTSVGVHQSAASSPQPVPEGAGPRLVTVRLFPGRTGDSNQVRVVPAASGGSATPTDSQMSRSLGPNPSLKVSQLVMVPAPGLPGKVIVPRLTPSTPTSPGQRMILKPVQTTSGVQYYRRPDGKLVRLVPISQLRSVNPTQTRSVQRVLLPQTPVLSVGAQISAPPSCSSSLPPLPAPLPPRSLLPVPSPLAPPPAVMAQRSTCSFKIFQSDSSKESMVVTCVKVPPPPPTKVVTGPASFTLLQPPPPAAPMNLLSLKPSTGRGPELGVRSVTVAPGGVLVHQKPQNIIQTPSGTLSPPPFTQGSQVTPASPPDPPVDRIIPEPTREQMDLDIVCVDDKTTLVATETMGGTKQPSDTEEPEGAVSSETENSSDLEEDTDGEKESITQRHIHNMLEKQRRGKLKQLLVDLRREVGQKEETSKICTLKKAVQVIQALRTTDTHLKKMKKRLTKRRDNYLNTIAGSELTRGNEVGLLSDMTDNSSDEERVVAKTTDMMAATNVADDVHSVAVETKDEVIHLNADHSLSSIMMDSKNSLSEKKSEQDQSVSTAFEALRSVMNDKHSARTHLLKQARREIQTLQTEMKILKSLKICLRQQRDAYLRKIRQRSGKNEQRILRKHLSSKKHRAANRLQASVGGGASKSTDDDIIISSSNLQLQTPTAPPSQTLSTTTPVQKLVPLMAPYTVSHNATGVRVKMRTIPNILSRSKKPTMTTVKELPSFQALVPAEVLSLVTASLPGQPVLTLGPVMSGLPVLQKSASPGVASVTLNISDLTNQQMHLTSMPCPPNGKMYCSHTPLTITNLTAENVNDLLQLVQPVTQQTTQQTMTQQTTQPVTQQMTHQTAQQQTTQQTMTQQPTQPVTQQTTQQTQQTMTQQITNQTTQQATQQTMTRQTTQQTTQQQMTQQQTTQQTTQKQTTQQPTQQQTTQQTTQKQMTQQQTTQQPTQQQQTQQQTTQQSTQVNLGESSSLGLQVEVPVGGALGGRADECLTSLLNEIVFLNQQTVTAATTAGVLLPGKSSFEAGLQEEGGAMGGAMEQGGARLLHPELDSVTMEMTEVTMSETHPAPAPPPLLQMKVGRAKEAEPSGSEEAAGGEGGVSWRPMPRLVPLGRTGNAPS
uniref:MAX dimerization protein MGA a isoform X2 n=1 Tax=Semicossyphus pulcher TaxID=241346 RepID=UPI0037E7636F